MTDSPVEPSLNIFEDYIAKCRELVKKQEEELYELVGRFTNRSNEDRVKNDLLKILSEFKRPEHIPYTVEELGNIKVIGFRVERQVSAYVCEDGALHIDWGSGFVTDYKADERFKKEYARMTGEKNSVVDSPKR